MFLTVFLMLFIAKSALSAGFHTDRLPPQVIEASLSHHNKCVKATGVAEEQIENLDMENTPRAVKCYMTCLGKDALWIGEDGEIDLSHILDKGALWKPFLGKAYDECIHFKSGPDECDLGYKMSHCFYKLEPEKFFLI